jgi:hypothetical protein
MAKPPIGDLTKAVMDALKSNGVTVSQKAIKQALAAETKGIVRKAPAKVAPKITRQTAAGGAGRKPPKPPKAGPAASAPKPKGPKGPKKPSGAKKEMTRAEKREMNVAKHWAEREKWLAETSAASKAAKAEKSAANSAAWAKKQDEMLARRMEGREKYNKKKKGNK